MPAVLDGVDDDDAEDQCGQGVHGLVALQKALGKGRALCGIGIGAQAVAAGGRHEGGAAQHRQCDDQNRGNDLAHVVHELAGEQRQQRHQHKVGDGEGQQHGGGVAHKWCQAHFKGHGCRARCGKEGAYGQVDGNGQNQACNAA